jgi:ATP-binding cassette subfamily B protein
VSATATAPTRSRLPRSFPVYRQVDSMDCGPTCLRMVARHYGRSYTLQSLREKSSLTRQGVSLLGIAHAAEEIGFRTLSVKTSFERLSKDVPLPCIAHWKQNHFVVVHRIHRGRVHLADPGEGNVVLSADEFLRGWALHADGEGGKAGVVLLLEPTPAFYDAEDQGERRAGLASLLAYVRGYGRFFAQVGLGMALAAVLQLVFPFLTQAVVDHGIANQDLGFVWVVLIAQLALFVSRTAVEFVRNRILFHVGTRVYVTIISDFLLKMMRLPVSFFDTRSVGDIMQRVQDHSRIQNFMTATTLNVAFSLLTLAVFSGVLALYSPVIFVVFLGGSLLHVGWVLLFLRRRNELDNQRFAEMSAAQNTLVELVAGMGEIKLANAEQQKRWSWERIQARMFQVNLRGLALEQAQDGGAGFLNELKNIAVTFLAARMVIQGDLTLGMLLAVQYIIGQLNSPLSQVIGLVRSAQDARISLGRLDDVRDAREEEEGEEKLPLLPQARSLRLSNVSFHYGGPMPRPVLHDLDLEIPEGKVTAIVGTSGSGKTTLLRLLCKFYEPTSGEIAVGGTALRNVAARTWRNACGVVMQDGQLFSDTIGRNVALGEEEVDRARLMHAARVANVHDFVESLPLAYATQVGRDGAGMSQGQKQRLLIARAVYKDPDYLFFDEATSALDANNERAIMHNLESFFRGRTVVVIAHRLSTVKNADQIVVLDQGRIVERGTHEALTALRGSYYELVKNQLELGN